MSAYRDPSAPCAAELEPAVLVVAPDRRGRETPCELRVTGSLLEVLRGGTVIARFVLDELSDVNLDTRTVQPWIGGSGAAAAGFVEGTVGPEHLNARLVLVARSGEKLALGDSFVAHFAAMEWLGKVRVFLRKQGWLPEDERDESP